MDQTVFSQNVTINRFDYSLTVLKCAYGGYKIIITDGDKNWVGLFVGDGNELDRLKSALREKDGMKYSITMINDSTINIHVEHALFPISDKYELSVEVVDDISSQLHTVMSKLKLLEAVQPSKTYPITQSMLGKGTKIGNCGLTNIQTLKRYLEFYISKIQFDYNSNSGSIKLDAKTKEISEHNMTRDYPDNIKIKDIKKYYKISHVHAEEKPVPTKNSIVFDGLIQFKPVTTGSKKSCVSEDCNVIRATNMYTVITKRYQTDDHIVGLIERDSDEITFSFCSVDENFTHTIVALNGNQTTSANYITIPLDDYYEQYLIALPFYVPDGVYFNNNGNYSLLVKNNKLYYNFQDLNLQAKTASVPSSYNFSLRYVSELRIN